jgi:hypothetical protein
MVTVVPSAPVVGDILTILGRKLVTVNTEVDVAVPTPLVAVIKPVVAPTGT